jgi:hypothetical protein
MLDSRDLISQLLMVACVDATVIMLTITVGYMGYLAVS